MDRVARKRLDRDRKDIEIINRKAERLNRQARDRMEYQRSAVDARVSGRILAGLG